MRTRSTAGSPSHIVIFHQWARRSLPPPGAARRGFTRLEAMVILATLGILAGVVLPVLANNKPRSERVICLNNLRQIGQGLQTWATDHGELFPCRVDTPTGPRGHPFVSQPWFQFSWISNHLRSPKVFACPADPEAKVARDWSDDPNWGFLCGTFRNNSISYYLGLDVFLDLPQNLLVGDRSMLVAVTGGTCSSGVRNPAGISGWYPAGLGWADGIHGESGNVLLTSGEALQLSRHGLYRVLYPNRETQHLLFPRPPTLAQ